MVTRVTGQYPPPSVYVPPTAGGVKFAHDVAFGTMSVVLFVIPQIGGVVAPAPEPEPPPEPPLGGATPVPERATVFGDDGAVLVIVSESL